jgi:hypothetical protein
MDAYLADMIQRHAPRQDDLLTRLIEAEVDGQRLSEQVLKLLQLLIARRGTVFYDRQRRLCLLPGHLASSPPPRARSSDHRHRGSPALPIAFSMDDAHAEARVEVHGQMIPAGLSCLR